MSYSTYVLYSSKYNEIYIGHSRDVEKRLVEHNEGKSSSTKRYIPWQLIHREEFATRSQAMKREKELKSQKGREWIRKEILKKHL
ncbi:MAG: GIY-YIG nuclease family protein [Melioribacteraceae bacterium]|nr:GIY-YIG nuclease family protein [Melioribacteraceae bacterium]